MIAKAAKFVREPKKISQLVKMLHFNLLIHLNLEYFLNFKNILQNLTEIFGNTKSKEKKI